MVNVEHALIGAALVGEGPEVAHVDLVIGKKGSSVEKAFVTALAQKDTAKHPFA